MSYLRCPICGAENFRLDDKYILHCTKCNWSTKGKRGDVPGSSVIFYIADKVGIPFEIAKDAAEAFGRYRETNSLRGTPLAVYAVAMLYITSTSEGVCYPLHYFKEASHIRSRTLNRTIKQIKKRSAISTICHIGYLPTYCATLHLPSELCALADTYAKIGVEHVSTTPRTTCAAAIYLAAKSSGVPISQYELGQRLGLSEVSIRSGVKAMNATIIEVMSTDVLANSKRASGKNKIEKLKEKQEILTKRMHSKRKQITSYERILQLKRAELEELDKKVTQIKNAVGSEKI